MRYIIFGFYFFTHLFCAEIDIKLYENNTQTQKYYQEIENIINNAEINKEKSQTLLNEEKEYLKKLRAISSQKITVSPFDEQLLKRDTVKATDFLKATLFLSEMKIKINQHNDFQNQIQEKLSFLKKKIENITESQKNQLLSLQLQFAYYKILKSNIESRLELFISYEKQLFELIKNTLPQLAFSSPELLEKQLRLQEEKIKTLLQKKASYEIDLEKEQFLSDSQHANTLKNSLQSIEVHYEKELKEIILVLNRKLLHSIVKNKEEEYRQLLSPVETFIKRLTASQNILYEIQHGILKDLAKITFGHTNFLINSSLSQSKDFYTKFKNAMTSTLFVFNEQAVNLLSLIKSLIIILFGFTLGFFYKKWLYKLSFKWPNMSQMSLKLTSNVGYYLIVLVTFMIALSNLGIDMSSISLIVGALSIGIGFGLQTVVSNFIAGIILMFERTMRIGDIIEISEGLKGTVSDIRIRSTTIKTFDNIDIVIPNSSFIQNNVINWTLEDASRRIHIPFGVAYGTKIEKVKEIIIKELLESSLIFIKSDENKKPEIRLEAMNSSSVDLELLVWVKANDTVNPNALKSDFLILIYNTLYKHNIEIPFPQLDLHIIKNVHSK